MQDNTVSFTALRDLLKADRTCRRFDEGREIGPDTLRSLVELCRFTASGRNAQPLRYRLVWDAGIRGRLFTSLAWAGYFKDWDGPAPGERPAAYMVQLLDTSFGANCLCDDGLQLQAITLGATALGIANCIIKSFDRAAVKETLALPDYLEPRYVLALGYPAETVVIEDMDGTREADFKYYRTADGVHHVPKRPLDELIV